MLISSLTGQTKHKVPAGVEEELKNNGVAQYLYPFTSFKF